MSAFLGAAGVFALAAVGQIQPPYQVVVRDAGAGGYQAFPDICRLSNGELLCVFYAGYGHVSLPNESLPRGARICAVRSSDEGRTWSDPTVVVDTPLDDRDPSVTQLSDGRLLCNFFTYTEAAGFHVAVVESNDLGKTWSEPHFPEVAQQGNFACSAPITELPSGELLLPVYYEIPSSAKAGLLRSFDGGRTWPELTIIDHTSTHRHDAEPHIIRLPDGRLFTALRPCMCLAFSSDQGHTWTVREAGFPGHCPHALVHSSGLLLLAHRLPETSLHLSADLGQTWQGPFVLDHVGGAYPSMVELRDGVVLCVYYEEGPGSAIRAVRFKPRPDGIDLVP